MPNFSRWLPFLEWPRPTPGLLRGEFVAGLTVAVVMIPQSVAYAGLAGMPLVTGLYAAFLPAVAAVLFSGSTRLSVGPSALTSLLVGASLIGLAEPGSGRWVELAVWLALLSGLIQLGLGAAGAAWVLNLVSSPVLAGFTQAAALLIIASQLPSLVGLQGPISSLWQSPTFDLAALGYGAASVLLFVLGKRYAPRLPVVLLVVAAAAAFSQWTGYAQRGAVIGELPAGLPALYWPGFPGWPGLAAMLLPALVIALVSSLEMASCARTESQHDGKSWNSRQDLIGQGLGKIASALSGSFPTSSSFSRSAITLYAGGRSGWATVMCSAVVLVVLLFLTGALYHVPRAVLAAVVVTAVAGLFKPRIALRLWQIDRVEAATALLTFGLTLLTAPRIYWGVLAGVVAGLAHFLYQRLHPRIIEVGLHPDGSLRDRNLWELAPLAPQVCALRMDAELDFASASAFERAIVDYLAAHPDVRHVVLFAHPINRIDATGVESFVQMRKLLADRGIHLHVSGLKLPVERALRKAWTLESSPLLSIYRTDAEALQALARAPVPPAPAAAQAVTIQPSSGSSPSGSP